MNPHVRSSQISVLIVDDSPVFRNLLRRALTLEEGCRFCAESGTGAAALDMIMRLRPDLVTLDLVLPDMDGLEVLKGFRRMCQETPSLTQTRVVVLSGHTGRDSDSGIKALELGAEDILTKPCVDSPGAALGAIRKELRNLCSLVRCLRLGNKRDAFSDYIPLATGIGQESGVHTQQGYSHEVKALVIGSSTGGPRALMNILPQICQNTDLPILVAQHMPADFTCSLARNLQRCCRHRCVEASGGEAVEKNTIYIAPGGRNMVVISLEGRDVVQIIPGVITDGCFPCVNVLFASAAQVWGANVMGIILTGMGDDGTAGASELRSHGAAVIVQDEKSSTVWGMPGSAWKAGVASRMASLCDIPKVVDDICAHIV